MYLFRMVTGGPQRFLHFSYLKGRPDPGFYQGITGDFFVIFSPGIYTGDELRNSRFRLMKNIESVEVTLYHPSSGGSSVHPGSNGRTPESIRSDINLYCAAQIGGEDRKDAAALAAFLEPLT